MKKALLFLFVIISIGSSAQCYPERHSTSWNDAWYSCAEQVNPNPDREPGHWIMYDLRHVYRLGKGKIWNINAPGRLTDGFRNFAVDYSQDGEEWETLGEYTLPIGPGDPLYEGEEILDFAFDSARYVLYTAFTNHGGECFGISEMKIEVIDVVSEQSATADGCLWAEIRPNPHQSSFFLEAGSNCPGIMEYGLYDPSGRMIKRSAIPELGVSNLEVNTTDLAEGVYHLVISQNGEKVMKRVVKIAQ